MDDFKNFLKENNYEDDLEFQLCDLEIAFNAGKELQWKPSDEQIRPLEYALDYFKKKKNDTTYLESLYQDLMKLREE